MGGERAGAGGWRVKREPSMLLGEGQEGPDDGELSLDTWSFGTDHHYYTLCTACMEQFQSIPPTSNPQQPVAVFAAHIWDTVHTTTDNIAETTTSDVDVYVGHTGVSRVLI